MPEQTIAINESSAVQCGEYLAKVLGDVTCPTHQGILNMQILERLIRLATEHELTPEHPVDE